MLMRTARRSLTRPLMQRGARACLHTDDVIALRSLLGKENVLDHDIDKYTTDWTKSYRGGGVVCLPGNTADVSAVLQYCNNRGIGVVPQGGNTGLVGGAVGRSAQELILSLSRMNRIFEVDADTRVLYCEAGCVLETLMQAAEAKNLVIPLDLGAKGSCMIGGNVSTNAGGLRVIKYGSLHSNVLGLEVVLADGSVVDALRGLRKDNCGYQSAHLFIGAEGTLGVVTKVAIALHSEPARVAVALIKVESFKEITLLLRRLRDAFGDFLSAFEYMDCSSLAVTHQLSPGLFSRFPEVLFPGYVLVGGPAPSSTRGDGGIGGPLYALVELTTGSGCEEHVFLEQMQSLLGGLMEEELVQMAILSQNSSEAKGIWKIRESIPVCLMQASRQCLPDQQSRGGKLFKYDISMKPSEMSGFVEAVRRGLAAAGRRVLTGVTEGAADNLTSVEDTGLEICTFGHVGDGNMHLNVLVRKMESSRVPEYKRVLDRVIFSEVSKRRGSISAEHGIGQEKAAALFNERGAGCSSGDSMADESCDPAAVAVRSPTELSLMKAVKAALDPRGIMNPGKVIPAPVSGAGGNE